MTRPLHILAFDCSTQQMSLGLLVQAAGSPLASATMDLHDAPGSAQASADLLPALQALMQRAGLRWADLDALAIGRGPGAFTGLRTATAVAQGLAWGTRTARHPDGLPVLVIDTLLAVADTARQHLLASALPQALPESGPLYVTALLDARMDEVYGATYAFDDAHQPGVPRCVQGPWLCAPEALAQVLTADAPAHPLPHVLAGNVFQTYAERLQHLDTLLPGVLRIDSLPTAAALLRLAPPMLAAGLAVTAAQAQPLYVRDKVAKTTQERAEARATQPASHA